MNKMANYDDVEYAEVNPENATRLVRRRRRRTKKLLKKILVAIGMVSTFFL